MPNEALGGYSSGPVRAAVSFRSASLHAGAWLVVFAGWLAAARAYHPTLAIAAGATAVLVAASAAAVYADHLFLAPRLAAARAPRWCYAACVLATVVILDLLAVPTIQLVYAWLWHPDPRRFGFWFNLASDGVVIAAHVAAAALLARVIRRRRGGARTEGSRPPPRSPPRSRARS